MRSSITFRPTSPLTRTEGVSGALATAPCSAVMPVRFTHGQCQPRKPNQDPGSGSISALAESASMPTNEIAVAQITSGPNTSCSGLSQRDRWMRNTLASAMIGAVSVTGATATAM